MAYRALTVGVGGLMGYASASNIEIPSELTTKYMGYALVGEVLVACSKLNVIAAIMSVPITLVTYTAGYQVGKIIHGVTKPAPLA